MSGKKVDGVWVNDVPDSHHDDIAKFGPSLAPFASRDVETSWTRLLPLCMGSVLVLLLLPAPFCPLSGESLLHLFKGGLLAIAMRRRGVDWTTDIDGHTRLWETRWHTVRQRRGSRRSFF